MRLKISKQELLNKISNELYPSVDVPEFHQVAPNSVASSLKYAIERSIKESVIESIEVLLNNCYTDEDFTKEFESELSK